MISIISTVKAGSSIHVAYGTSVELPNSPRKRLMEATLILENLRTNESAMLKGQYKIEAITPKSLRKKINLYIQYVKENKNDFKLLLKAISTCSILLGISLASLAFIKFVLPKLHEDILNRRLIYTSNQLVKMDEYYFQSVMFWLNAIMFAIFGGISACYALDRFQKFKASLVNFGNDFCELKCQLEEVETPFPSHVSLCALSNESNDTSIRDPISFVGIKKEWSHAPRFIKVGNYLFTLESILKQLFLKHLEGKKIIHPCEVGRSLTDDEQEKLTADLSLLFQIPQDEFQKLWDPFILTGLDDLILEMELSNSIPEWSKLELRQQRAIKAELRNDIFANHRLIKFIEQLPDEVKKAKIHANDTEFFTFEEMLSEVKQSRLTYHIIP